MSNANCINATRAHTPIIITLSHLFYNEKTKANHRETHTQLIIYKLYRQKNNK